MSLPGGGGPSWGGYGEQGAYAPTNQANMHQGAGNLNFVSSSFEGAAAGGYRPPAPTNFGGNNFNATTSTSFADEPPLLEGKLQENLCRGGALSY